MNTIKLKIGTDDFAKLLLESNVFVDKSMFIKEFLEDHGDVVLITRPRRWGKSLNMDMLGRFLEIEVDAQGVPLPQEDSLNHKLFAGGEVDLGFGDTKLLNPLKINSYPATMKFQGQFPVISLTLKGVKMSTYQAIIKGVNKQINGLFKRYKYLLQSSQLSEEEVGAFKQYAYGSSDDVDLADSLRFLSELLYQHFGQLAQEAKASG